jgi:monoamine oxidase
LICSIPFTVFRNIEVVPAFSAGKRAAIQDLGYASGTRVFVQVKRRYWEEGLSGFGLTDAPTEIWQPTWDQPGPRAILASYTRHGEARHITTMADDERVATTLHQLDRVFPGIHDHAEEVVAKAWDKDEWARGLATQLKPGQMTSLWPDVARPEGRIHFAGEHTSSWATWMQGALESGIRAAREVNDAA